MPERVETVIIPAQPIQLDSCLASHNSFCPSCVSLSLKTSGYPPGETALGTVHGRFRATQFFRPGPRGELTILVGVGRPDLRGRRQGILMDSSAMALMDWRSIMNVAHSGTNSPYSLCIRSTGTDRGDEW